MSCIPALVGALAAVTLTGCSSGHGSDSGRVVVIVMWLYGGRASIGDRVGLLVVHSQRLNPGILDCIVS